MFCWLVLLACQVALAAPIASVLLSGRLAAQPLIRSVLVIDEGDPVRPAHFPFHFAFQSTLNKGLTTPVTIFEENIDLVVSSVHSSRQLWALISEKSIAKARSI